MADSKDKTGDQSTSDDQNKSRAERIKSRLEKQKTQSAEKEKVAKEKEKEPVPINAIDVTLTGEMAPIGQALQKKYIDHEKIVNAFLVQYKFIKRKENISLLNVLLQEKNITKDQLEELKKSNNIIIKVPRVAPRQIDFVLAQKLVEDKLITREEIDPLLRIGATLRRFGIYRSLEYLVVTTKLLAPEIITPLLGQFKKSKAEVVHANKSRAIAAPKRQTYPIVTIILVSLITFGAMGYGWLTWQVKRQDKKAKEPKPQPVTKVPQYVIKQEKAGVKKIELQELPEKETTTAKNDRIKWGTAWITLQQKEALIAGKISVGSKARTTDLEFVRGTPKIKIMRRRGQYLLAIRGKLRRLAEMPPGLHFKVKAQLYHFWREEFVDKPVFFELDGEHSFVHKDKDGQRKSYAVLGPFNRPLGDNIYAVHLSIIPEQQSEFIRYYFRIDKVSEWWVTILPSKGFSVFKQDSAKYTDQLKSSLKLMNRLYREIQKLSNLCENKEGKTAKKHVRVYWNRNITRWQRELDKIQKQMSGYYEERLIPIYPDSEKKLSEALTSLNVVFKKWDDWQDDIVNYSIPDCVKEYNKFQKDYTELESQFKADQSRLVTFLENFGK